MKRIFVALLLICLFIVGCVTQVSNNSKDRSDIVKWARQIAKYEKDSQIVMENYNQLTIGLVNHYPSEKEILQLTTYNNLITYMYNELLKIEPPPDSSSVHQNYVEYYSKASESILFYIIAIRQNDLSYFEKSVVASKEGNRIGDIAYAGFVELLNKYSISCEEIDFCE